MKSHYLKVDRNDASLLLLKRHKVVDAHPTRVLDCGSRDGVLLRRIGSLLAAESLVAIDWHNRFENEVNFISHNLEYKLPFDSKAFDVVVCNDVIEHVEKKKQLFSELQRCSSELVVISLPNTQYWQYIRGLVAGKMSKQYDFLVDDGADRHRWITYFDQNTKFVINNLQSDYVIADSICIVPDKWMPKVIAKLFRRFSVFNQMYLLKRLHEAS